MGSRSIGFKFPERPETSETPSLVAWPAPAKLGRIPEEGRAADFDPELAAKANDILAAHGGDASGACTCVAVSWAWKKKAWERLPSRLGGRQAGGQAVPYLLRGPSGADGYPGASRGDMEWTKARSGEGGGER